MAALKNSLFTVFLSFTISCSASFDNLLIENQIKTCFSLENPRVEVLETIVVLKSRIIQPSKPICPCKSALTKYEVSQASNGTKSKLLTSYFTILGKNEIILPISSQHQLIFPDKPISIELSCANQQ